MDNNMHGTTTTRIINQPHETRPPSYRQFPQWTARRDGSARHSGTGPGQKRPSPPCFPAAHPRLVRRGRGNGIRRQLLLCSFRRATGDILPS